MIVNNEGLHVACQSCTQRMVESMINHNVAITISNLTTTGDKCTIEDGLLGGHCGNSGVYLVTITEVKKKD